MIKRLALIILTCVFLAEAVDAYALRVPLEGIKRVEEVLYPVTINGLLSREYVEHDMAVREVVNPDNRKLEGAYGGSGADLSNVFLSTNAAKIYFLDRRQVHPDRLKFYLEKKQGFDGPAERPYSNSKFKRGFAYIAHLRDIELAIIVELEALGVTKEDMVNVDKDEDGNARMRFYWAYHGEAAKRLRTVIFIKEDIRKPRKSTNIKMRGRLDFYYQRAPQDIAETYLVFIGTVAEWIKPNGIMITCNYNALGVHHEPGLPDFILIEPTDKMKFWAGKILKLREGSTANYGLYYGWNVKLRMKKPAVLGLKQTLPKFSSRKEL